MLVDYKFKSIHRDGKNTTIVATFYKGAITTEDEEDTNGDIVPITRYRRTKIIKSITRTISGTPTDQEIRRKTNQRLAIYSTETGISVIPEQTDV